MEQVQTIIFGLISGVIGYGISFLLSKIHHLMAFFIPVAFTLLSGLLFLATYFGDYGWGALVLLIYALLTAVIAGTNWIASTILYDSIKKKANRNTS